jgi:hypothetical protein
LDTNVLYQNELSGLIPSTIGNLTNFRILTLFSNALSGNIRTEINSLRNLKKLQLGDNNFIGDKNYRGNQFTYNRLFLKPTYRKNTQGARQLTFIDPTLDK